MILACLVPGFASGQERDEAGNQEQKRPREGQTADRDIRFQPQNDRERALWNMIQQLRSEVAQLRQQIANRERRGAAADNPVRNTTDKVRREGDMGLGRDSVSQGRASNDPLLRQAGRIFAAYDKNRDQRVSFDEWLAMREGEMTSERRFREMGFFSEQAGDDRMITLEEFYHAMLSRRRGSNVRESGVRESGARDAGPRESGARDAGPRESGTRERATRVRDGG